MRSLLTQAISRGSSRTELRQSQPRPFCFVFLTTPLRLLFTIAQTMLRTTTTHNPWGRTSTPRAPRINPCPLPEVRSPLRIPPIPIAISSPPPATSMSSTIPRPSTTHRRRHHGSTDEPGYSSSLEPSSAAPRPRPSSHVVRTPLAPAPPLKGILKTGEGNRPEDHDLLM